MPVALASHSPVSLAVEWRWQRDQKFFASQQMGGVVSREPTHRHRFNVTFDAGNLSGEEDVLMLAHLHGCREHAWRVDVSVAMNLAKLKELGAFEPWNCAQHPRLFAITQMILKTYH